MDMDRRQEITHYLWVLWGYSSCKVTAGWSRLAQFLYLTLRRPSVLRSSKDSRRLDLVPSSGTEKSL